MSEAGYVAVGCAVAVFGALRAAWSPCGQSMLASLTPLGERSRGFSWKLTYGAFAVGAVAAGSVGGTLLALLGSLLPSSSGWREGVLAGVLVTALVIDATPLRTRLPRTKRQVNEDWMATYRGWVYGAGFGAQLGLGFITLVACAAIYATFATEVLSGSAGAGAAIGAVFGATKALSLLPAVTARDHASLLVLHRRLLSLERGSERAVVAGELLAVAALVAVVV